MAPKFFHVVLVLWLVLLTGFAYDLFDRDCVTAHNRLRKLHGAQPLSWSESLAEDAQNWAEYLAQNDKIQHDVDTLAEKDEGENIAWFTPPQPKCQGAWKADCVTCGEVVQNWYEEVKSYDFQKGTAKQLDEPISHFAQVVWNGSMEMGFGSAISKTYGFISVARYSPKGGVGGRQAFRKNIFPRGPRHPPELELPDSVDTSGPTSTEDKFLPTPTGRGPTRDEYDEEGMVGPTPPTAELQRPMADITCGIGKRGGPLGDEAVKPGEFPWQVGFRYENRFGRSNVFCRGSLLDKEWIITAAHCFVVRVHPKFKLKVILGEFDDQNEDGQEVIAEASKVIRHPLHRKNSKDYNIALVKLKMPLKEYSDYIRPICLPDQTISFSEGEICTVSGFGLSDIEGKEGKLLRRIDVPVVSREECRSKILWLTDRMICSGYTERVIETCKGDSGGPLACYKNGKFYLGGVVSHGKRCSRVRSPNVYTNVKYLRPWITHVTKNN